MEAVQLIELPHFIHKGRRKLDEDARLAVHPAQSGGQDLQQRHRENGGLLDQGQETLSSTSAKEQSVTQRMVPLRGSWSIRASSPMMEPGLASSTM